MTENDSLYWEYKDIAERYGFRYKESKESGDVYLLYPKDVGYRMRMRGRNVDPPAVFIYMIRQDGVLFQVVDMFGMCNDQYERSDPKQICGVLAEFGIQPVQEEKVEAKM